MGLPGDGSTMGVDRGKLYVKTPETSWSYRVFDLDNLTTDGAVKGAPTDITGPAGFIRCSRWSPIPTRGGPTVPHRSSIAS